MRRGHAVGDGDFGGSLAKVDAGSRPSANVNLRTHDAVCIAFQVTSRVQRIFAGQILGLAAALKALEAEGLGCVIKCGSLDLVGRNHADADVGDALGAGAPVVVCENLVLSDSHARVPPKLVGADVLLEAALGAACAAGHVPVAILVHTSVDRLLISG